MKSESYWKKRAALRMYSYQAKADEVADDITKSYIEATNYINGEIKSIFRTFQINGNLSETEAKELLNNLPDKTTLDNLKEIFKQVKDPEKRQALLNQINAPAYAFRIKRFEQLQKDIDEQTEKLAVFEQNAGRVHYVDLAHEAYNRVIFDIQKGMGIGFSFTQMPTSRIREILNHNWSGKLFSERIWGRTEELNQTIKRELLTQFMTGRSYQKTAKEIEERMAVGAMEARRLVRTESTYIANSAEIESYKECGIEKFKFLATLDMRTSDLCRRMDGKEFKVDDASFGTNVPPLHPWCRSTTIAVIDGAVTEDLKRSARDPKTGRHYEVPADMSYEEWQKDVDKRHGAGTWQTERKKIINAPEDIEQYKRYKAVLGKKNMPKTFDLFQEMKYNNVEGWDDLKYYYRNINGRPIECVKIDRELEKLGILRGKVHLANDGIKAYILPDANSKREPYHIMSRMKERYITDDEVRSYKDNAKFSVIQRSGQRRVYYSDEGVSVISQTEKEWIYKTAWRKEDFDENVEKIIGVMNKYVK